MANKSNVCLVGVVEDVVVQVNDLFFPAGLYILDMELGTNSKGSKKQKLTSTVEQCPWSLVILL